MKTQRFKTAKQLISASVSQEARSLLEQNATVTGQTMSDILDKLIKATFKPKRGLAKRIAKDKAKALADFATHEQALKADLADLEEEWLNSFQSKLVWMTEQGWENTEDRDDHLSFWLFSRRVFSMRNKSGQWCSGLHLAKACQSWMNNPLLPDKYLAADLAAETSMVECPEGVYEYLITTLYNGSEREAFEDFCRHDVSVDSVYTGFMTNLDLAADVLTGLEQIIDTRKYCRDLRQLK